MTAYYVDAKDGKDSGDGSSGQPWKSLGKAAASIAAGDQVLVAPGTYHEQLTIETPSTWVSTQRWGAVIDGYYSREHLASDGKRMPSPLNGGPNGTFLPHISNTTQYSSLVALRADNLIFDGFAVVNSAQIGVTVSGDGSVLRNCRVDYARAQGVRVIQADDVVVDGNVITHAMLRRADGHGPASGAIIMAQGTDGCVMRRNIIAYSPGDGLVVNNTCTHILVEDNVIHSTSGGGNLMNEGSRTCVFRRNVVYNVAAQYYEGSPGLIISFELASKEAGQGVDMQMHDNLIVNGTTMIGIRNSEKTSTVLDGAYIGFNTFVSGPDTRTFINAPANQHGKPHRSGLIENNVFGVVGGINSGSMGGVVLRNNVWSQQPPPAWRGADDVTGNLMLANPGASIAPLNGTGYYASYETTFNAGDYQPKADSPVIGAASDGGPAGGVTPPRKGRNAGTIEYDGGPVSPIPDDPSPDPDPDDPDDPPTEPGTPYALVYYHEAGWVHVIASDRQMAQRVIKQTLFKQMTPCD